jgi:hypothetical protein
MKFLTRISILYLTIPVILFLFGWLRLFIAIPATLIILFALWQSFKQPIPDSQFPNHRSSFLFPLSSSTAYLFLLTALWLLLSGIGGYAFQNWDHNWRNAVFHDLINFNFPVYYTQPDSGPIKMLVYYVGYWLPSVLVGKVLGWQAANFALFLWTWLGVILVALHLASALKTSPVKSTLLLIFFSGLDVLGTLFFAKDYPTLLPPITHLEIWSGSLQYSSFTTQLFWVFNQAVPAWLCITVIMESNNSLFEKQEQAPALQILLWSLCFFFAPLASIGLFPYVLIELFKQTDFKSPFKNLRWEQLLAAIVIFLLSAFFFSANNAAQQRGLNPIPFSDFIAFFLLEGGLLWLVLAPSKYRDPRWMVTGILLAIIPFIQLGSGRDFVMRASIAPLLYLMLMTGETLFHPSTSRFSLITRYSLLALLALGSLTPLYEINRSIYRTYEYYFVLDRSACGCEVPAVVTHLKQGIAPEAEHPTTLTADGIPTLKFMNDELSKNFIANVRQTFFYKYLARH